MLADLADQPTVHDGCDGDPSKDHNYSETCTLLNLSSSVYALVCIDSIFCPRICSTHSTVVAVAVIRKPNLLFAIGSDATRFQLLLLLLLPSHLLSTMSSLHSLITAVHRTQSFLARRDPALLLCSAL